MIVTLTLSVLLSANPAPLTHFQFETKLSASVKQLCFARYVATSDLTSAVVVCWTGRENQLNPPELIFFCPTETKSVFRLNLDANQKQRVEEFTPPPPVDPLLDEPVTTVDGAWLHDLLKGLTQVSNPTTGDYYVLSDPQKKAWQLVIQSADQLSGAFYNRGANRTMKFTVQPQGFSELLKTLASMKFLDDQGTYHFGNRGHVLETPTTLYLNLAAPWSKLPLRVTPKKDGYIVLSTSDFEAAQVGPFQSLSGEKVKPEALVITVPKPKIDPLVAFLSSP